MPDRSTFDVPPIVAIGVLLSSLTFFWYLAAIDGITEQMSALDVWLIPTYIATLLIGQFVALVIASQFGRRLLGSLLPAYLFSGALFTVNFYGGFLALFGPFMVLDAGFKWAVRAAVFGTACILTSEIYQSRAIRIGALIVGPLLLIGQIAAVMLSAGIGPASVSQDSTQAQLSPGTATDVETVRKVEFARRANVYLIAFDALTSDEVASRYIGIAPPLAYTSALVSNGARLIPNAFVDRAPTRPSLNSLLVLDVNHFDSLSQSQQFEFLTGLRRSPVTEIFRHNGYRIQTMFEYIDGRRQGPYVDFYGVTNLQSICDQLRESRWRFLGFCIVQDEFLWPAPTNRPSASVLRYSEFVRQRIHFAVRDGRPWLTLAYFFLPGHVPPFYDHRRASDRDAYRAKFADNQNAAAREIDAVFATIREVDPGALVLVFGDHGTLMSRGAKYASDREFFVLDRHAIRMAMWPATACRSEFDEQSRGGFVTVAMAMRAIITCLAGGSDPVSKSVTYSLPYAIKDFGRYLYDDIANPSGGAPKPAR